MRYYLNKKISDGHLDKALIVDIISQKTFIEKYQTYPHAEHVIRHIDNIVYCKVELFYDVICGALAIPDKMNLNQKHCFNFYLTPQHLILIDEDDYVLNKVMMLKETFNSKQNSLNKLLHDLIFLIIVDDGIFIQSFAQTLQDIEDRLNDSFNIQINDEIMRLRKELLILNAYYNQLGDMIDILSENELNFLNDYECHLFSMLARRVDRLDNQLNALKEYSLQIKEMYQSKIATHENKIMTILTIATTIFFPLSIITGWYGMNFKNMPELNNPYGYMIIIGASILVVVIEMIILKKKKFF